MRGRATCERGPAAITRADSDVRMPRRQENDTRFVTKRKRAIVLPGNGARIMAGAANGNGNGTFFQKFQGVASIGGVLFLMIATVAGLGYSALSDRLSKIEASRFSAAEFGQYRERIDERLAKLDAEVLRLRLQIITREEHEAKDRERLAVINGIASRIARVERDFGATYTLKDAIADMQKRMDRLSNLVVVPQSGPRKPVASDP